MGDTPFCTGATLVIRPPQGIRESLAYAGGFLHLLPHLTTHPEAPLKSEYRSAAGERLAVEWYHRVSRAFYFGKVSSGDELRHVISARLERMAELLGVCVEFDLCGIILRVGEQIEWGLFTAALIAAMLSAARISPTGELRIWLLRAENGDPLLQAEIGCGAPDALPELAPLRRAATLRGTVCESFYMEEAHCMVLRASLCYVPLEKQDVKEQLPKLSRLLSDLDKQRSKSIPRELREAALELHFDEEG
jgi:hypothetical protein